MPKKEILLGKFLAALLSTITLAHPFQEPAFLSISSLPGKFHEQHDHLTLRQDNRQRHSIAGWLAPMHYGHRTTFDFKRELVKYRGSGEFVGFEVVGRKEVIDGVCILGVGVRVR